MSDAIGRRGRTAIVERAIVSGRSAVERVDIRSGRTTVLAANADDAFISW